MEPQLAGLGIDSLDVGIVRGRNRLVTRAIASWPHSATDPDGNPACGQLIPMTSEPTHLLRRGRQLEVATLAWNVIGVIVLAVAAVAARRGPPR